MKATQRNQHSMAVAVLYTLNTYKSLWSDKVKVVESVNTLQAFVDKIWKLIQEQERVSEIEGLSENKKILRKSLIEMTDRVCGAIRCIVADQKREDVIAQLNYSPNQLKRKSQTDFITALKMVVKYTLTYKEQLVQHYDLTAEWLETYSKDVDKFEKQYPAIKSLKADIKVSTEKLASTCSQMSNHLKNNLDQEMKRFYDEPIHIAYTNSRKIYNYTNCQTTLAGYLVDELRSSIKGATLHIRVDGWRQLTIGHNGHFIAKQLKDIHTASIRATAPGYLSAEYDISLREGHTTNFDIIMIWDTQQSVKTDKVNSVEVIQ